MTSFHRPLSAWIAQLNPETAELGRANDGQYRCDARNMPYFAQGWKRTAVPWGHQTYVLGLGNEDSGAVVVELDDYGSPIVASAQAISTIGQIELHWPRVEGPLVAALLTLDRESLPVRFWLLERLDAEGDPPDEVFSILPWDLLDRAIEALSAALRPGGTIGELVEIGHWLTPATRGLTGPLEQLDEGLRTADGRTASLGTSALLANLRDIPLSRIPRTSLAKLRQLVDQLGQADSNYRELAEAVSARLMSGQSPGSDMNADVWFDALLVGAAYLGPNDTARSSAARLEFTDSAAEVLGPNLRGTVSRSKDGLSVTLVRFESTSHALTVEVGEPGHQAVPMIRRGQALHALVPWERLDLPERLLFRVVATPDLPGADSDEQP